LGALFVDSDLVQIADVTVRLTPSQKEYKKGARIEAVLNLPIDFAETNKVTVSARKG
jgi:hypothetical protein